MGPPTIPGRFNAALTSAISQGIGVATGLQSKFSFAGVAAAGVAAGVGAALGGRLPSLNDNGSAGNIASHLAVGGARLLASAATRSALEGSSFGRNITAGLPDVLAQTLVDSAVGAARRGGSAVRERADGGGASTGGVNMGALESAVARATAGWVETLGLNVALPELAMSSDAGGAVDDSDVVVTASSRRPVTARQAAAASRRAAENGGAPISADRAAGLRGGENGGARIANGDTSYIDEPWIPAMQRGFDRFVTAHRNPTGAQLMAETNRLLAIHYEGQDDLFHTNLAAWNDYAADLRAGRANTNGYNRRPTTLREQVTGNFAETSVGTATVNFLNELSFGTVELADSRNAMATMNSQNPTAAILGQSAGIAAGVGGVAREGLRELGEAAVRETAEAAAERAERLAVGQTANAAIRGWRSLPRSVVDDLRSIGVNEDRFRLIGSSLELSIRRIGDRDTARVGSIRRLMEYFQSSDSGITAIRINTG